MQIKPKPYPLHQSPFFKLRSRKRLAALLKLSPAELAGLAERADTIYSEFDVAKKSGGVRGVENPRSNLKMVQRKIAQLLARIAPPDYLFFPVKGRCYVTNAAQHRGQRVVRCMDVRKYFPSTSSKRVFWFCRSVMHCEIDVAALLTRLACYKGHLPTGSPLSPIMAYFAHYDVWGTISAICNAHGYRLTVYIDDVTISGNSIDAAVIWDIKRAIHKSGLRYHKEKRFVGRPSEITGVIVAGDKLQPPNRQLKKLNETRCALRTPSSSFEKKKLQDRLHGLRGQMAQIATA